MNSRGKSGSSQRQVSRVVHLSVPRHGRGKVAYDCRCLIVGEGLSLKQIEHSPHFRRRQLAGVRNFEVRLEARVSRGKLYRLSGMPPGGITLF